MKKIFSLLAVAAMMLWGGMVKAEDVAIIYSGEPTPTTSFGNAAGDSLYFASSNKGNIENCDCDYSVTQRVQVSSFKLLLGSTSASKIMIYGNSSSGTAGEEGKRTITSIKVGSTIDGAFENVSGAAISGMVGTPGAGDLYNGSLCFSWEISNIDIEQGKYLEVTFSGNARVGAVVITPAAGGAVDVIKTDLKDLTNVAGGAPIAVNASSGAYNATVGQLTAINGVNWMHATRPEIVAGGAADTVGKYYIRLGNNPEPFTTLPTNRYVDFENTEVPFVSGGTITALISANHNEGGSVDVYGVYGTEGVKLASLEIATPDTLREITAQLPDTLNGVRKLKLVRNSGSSIYLWSLHVTTNSGAPAVTVTPETLDLSAPRDDGASQEVVVKANAGVSGDLALALQSGAVFEIDKNTMTAAKAQLGDTVVVTLPTSAAEDTYKDTLVISGGGLAAAVKVPIAAIVGPPDNTPPVATTLSPANGATNVPLDVSLLYAVFDEPIRVADATKITFNSTAVASALVVDDTVLTIVPAAEPALGALCTVSIAAEAVTDMSAAQNPTAAAIIWSFTIDGTAPVPTDTTPAEGAEKIAINVKPSFTFNEKVKVVNANLTAAITPGDVNVTLAVGAGDTVITVTPASNLEYLTAYTLTIPADSIADISGNLYAQPLVLHFTTKEEVQGAFYTDFATTPDEMAAYAPATQTQSIGIGPVTKDGVIMGGHSGALLDARAAPTTSAYPIPAHLPEASGGYFLGGGNTGYLTLPPMQGPCMVYFYHGTNGGDKRGWFLTNNGAKAGVTNAIVDGLISGEGNLTDGIFYQTTDNTDIYRLDSFLYTEEDMVTFTFTSGRSARMYDILVRSVVADTQAPELTFIPADGASNVPTDAVFKAVASKPMYRKNDKTVRLTNSDMGNYVTVSKDGVPFTAGLSITLDNDTIKVSTSARWEGGSIYTVSVDTVSNDWGYKSDVQSASFTISSSEVLATGIEISGLEDEQDVAVGQTVTLSADVTPSNATNKSVTWTLEDGEEFATLNAAAPSVTATAVSGATPVRIRATANGGTNLYDEVEFYVVGGGGTLVAKNAAAYGIVLSPNPTSGLLDVKSNVILKQVKVFSVSSGALLQSQPLNGASVDLSALAAGSYIVLLFPESGAPAAVQVVKQ